jgi:hypothetical protein
MGLFFHDCVVTVKATTILDMLTAIFDAPIQELGSDTIPEIDCAFAADH